MWRLLLLQGGEDILVHAGRPLRPEGSLSSSALEDLLDEDARLPYVKCLPVSHCVRHGREGVRSMSTSWRSFAGALWHHMGSISRPGWRRFLGQALAHHLCRAERVEVCAENAGLCPLGCLTAHLTLLLSAPRSYRLDGLFTPNKVPMIWEQLGVGLGYILWNPTGFKLLDVLYSGWPIFALLRELRWKLIRLKGSEADEYRDLHRLRRSMMFDGPLDAAMARIICIYQPKRIEETSCPVLEAENALEKAEEMVFQKTTSIWQSHEKHSAFEKLLTKAETELRRLLPWFQAPAEEFQSPAARLAVGLLIAGDVALPRLERLQRQLRRFTSKAQPLGDYPSCGSELPEQGALVAEARYVQGLFNQLSRPVLTGGQPRAQPKEAWVTFLWGGSGTAERRAWIYGEAIRTLAHSVRRVEVRFSRPFLVLTVGLLPGLLLEELKAENLTVMPVNMDATRPPVLPKSRHGSDAWFEERGLEPVFPQLAAWSLPFDRVVVLDADTLVLENCDELFDLGPVPFASGYEMHQEQLDISRHDGSRTYLLNAGVMTLRPDLHFLEYMWAVSATEAFRGRLEHYAEGTFPTFQQFLDIFLLEATDRRGFATWDDSSFLGCVAYERGLAGSVWAPVHAEEILPPERLSHLDHCRLPLDYHFLADFPHVFQMAQGLRGGRCDDL
ncbi:unnamed protein product [Durusdinium trenchii]|uniref:Uncharacterized protein n=1 Tax=Durusdinium trenchii TaxID=1381693 RepID=A0ABP0K723_9DINO